MMRPEWRKAAALAAAVVTGIPAARAAAQDGDAAGAVVTLEQAVASALASDRRVQNATIQVERAQKSLDAARTRRLPGFDLEAQASQLVVPVQMTFPAGAFGNVDPVGPIPATNTTVESSTDPVVSVTGRIVQPLSGLHRIGLGIRQREIGRDLERERLRGERIAVANQVRRLYYSVLANEHALEACRQQLAVEHELVQVVSQQVEKETTLRSAMMDAEARRAAQEYTLLRLQSDLASSRERLNVLMGRGVDAPLQVAAVPEDLPAGLDLDTAQRRAVASRPDLAQARLQVDLAEADRRSKKSEFIPDISLSLSYQSFFNVDLLPRDITQVGVVLDWEPFDWGRKHRELGEKSGAVGQARNTIASARDQALIEVRDRYRRVEEARALLAARRLALASAREKARVAVNRRAEEMSLLPDAMQAEAALTDANSQYVQAVLSLWTARADLEEVVGETP